MGRWRAIPLMMSLCLLAGCGGGGDKTGEDLALEIGREFAAMTACSGQVELTADYANRTFECALELVYDNTTGATLTILEPELARGVAAHIGPEGTELTYDGFSLDAGPVTDTGLAPVEAVPALYEAITQGYIAVAELGEETLTVTYRDGVEAPGSGLEAVVVFDVETHFPLTGELFWDGARVVSVQLSDFQMMTSPEPGGA